MLLIQWAILQARQVFSILTFVYEPILDREQTFQSVGWPDTEQVSPLHLLQFSST